MSKLKRRFKKIRWFILSLVLIILILELSEQKNSYLKTVLYNEKEADLSLTIATVAMKCDTNPSANRAKMGDVILKIVGENKNIDLVFFGETITSWYKTKRSGYHKRISESIPGPTTQLISELALKNKIYISFGIVEKFDNHIHNSQVLIDTNGKIINIQRKKNLRSSAFEAGESAISVVDINGVKTGIVICADAKSAEAMKLAKEHEVDLILISNADWSDEWDKHHFAYRYLAKKYNAWIVTANRYGREEEIYWDGHLEILDPLGEMKAYGKLEEQHIIYRLGIDKSCAKKSKRKMYNKITLIYLLIKNVGILSHYV